MGTITQTVDAMMGELDHDLQVLNSRRDFEMKIGDIQQAAAEHKISRLQLLLAELFRMFDESQIQYETGKPLSYYQNLIQNSDLPDFSDYESQVLHALYRQYQSFPTPSQYLARIVKQNSNPEDHWESDSLRLRILKQFIKYGNYLADAGYGGRMVIRNYVKQKTGKTPDMVQVLSLLDDGVFSVLENSDKAFRKPSGKYGLLKLADDLANEKYRAEGATRQSLYLFAMVYGLKFEPYEISSNAGAGSDLEKALFRDYYSNNLMRWLSDAYKPGMTEFEVDPTGMGINFKNFAEVVYLYYLSSDLPAQEKISRSAAMIQRLIESADTPAEKELSSDSGSSMTTFMSTGNYRSAALKQISRILPKGRKLTELDEEELFETIRNGFDTQVWKRSEKTGKLYRIGEMQVMNTQNSAFREYQRLLRLLDEAFLRPEDCSYGLWFADLEALQSDPRLADLDPAEKQKFLKVLGAADSYLKGTLNASSHPLKIASSEKVTRSALLFAYYYWFNENYFDDEQLRKIPFSQFFQYFKNGMGDEKSIDEIFEDSFYQPLSGRNIIDVLTAFSSYVYINS